MKASEETIREACEIINSSRHAATRYNPGDYGRWALLTITADTLERAKQAEAEVARLKAQLEALRSTTAEPVDRPTTDRLAGWKDIRLAKAYGLIGEVSEEHSSEGDIYQALKKALDAVEDADCAMEIGE